MCVGMHNERQSLLFLAFINKKQVFILLVSGGSMLVFWGQIQNYMMRMSLRKDLNNTFFKCYSVASLQRCHGKVVRQWLICSITMGILLLKSLLSMMTNKI
jgi:hypothetical protein